MALYFFSVEQVAGIAKSRHDVAVLVELMVYVACPDSEVLVREIVFDKINGLIGRDD